MGYPTKVQRIQRQASQQWYVNFPAALAAALEFSKGEVVEWIVQDKNVLTLRRTQASKAKPAQRSAKKNGSPAPAHQRLVGRRYGCFPATPHLAACQPDDGVGLLDRAASVCDRDLRSFRAAPIIGSRGELQPGGALVDIRREVAIGKA